MKTFGMNNRQIAEKSLIALVLLIALCGQFFKCLIETKNLSITVVYDTPTVRRPQQPPPPHNIKTKAVQSVYPLEEPTATLAYWDLWKTLESTNGSNPIMTLTGREDWTRIYANFDRPQGWEDFPCANRFVRALPVNQATFCAAGPKLCSLRLDAPYREADQRCAASVDQLDSYDLLAQGNAIKFTLDDRMQKDDFANVVVDRERKSAASGVIFLDLEYIAVASFAKRMVYVYKLDFEAMDAILVDKIFNLLPTNSKGEVIDLIGYDGKSLLATSNLLSASSTIFNFDWETKKLSQVQGAYAFADLQTTQQRQMAHGVRFYPSPKGESSIIALTAQLKLSPSTLAVRFFDWKTNTTRAELLMSKTPHAGLGPQDVFFIDKYNMLVAYTPNYVHPLLGEGEYCRDLRNFNTVKFSSRIVHYRLHFDLDEELENNQPICSERFEELQRIDYPHSHPDSISYNDGILIVSDQLNDHVTFVAVDPSGQKNMTHLGVLTGFHMNHGVALSPNLDYFAASQYGDNSVIVSRFPSWLEKRFEKYRVSLQEGSSSSH